MFDKTLSIPDSLARDYFTLLTTIDLDEADKLIKQHPREAKLKLALEMVRRYHGPDAAGKLESAYHEGSAAPRDLTQKAELARSDIKDGKAWIVKIVRASTFASSNSEARRLILSGAVQIGEKKVTDPDAAVDVKEGLVLRIGRKRVAVVSIRQD
jgi:tyrosyl-tRNA synthetase